MHSLLIYFIEFLEFVFIKENQPNLNIVQMEIMRSVDDLFRL